MLYCTVNYRTERSDHGNHFGIKEGRENRPAHDLSGISLSQWSLENLLASAREVIARSGHTVMSPEDFDAFTEALDRPLNPKLERFVSQRSVWEQ